MKYLFFLICSGIIFCACQSNDESKNSSKETATANSAPDQPSQPAAAPQPQGREHPLDNRILDQPQVKEAMKNLKPQAHNTSKDGEPILIRKVNLTNPVNQMMVQKGQKVHQERCAGCHSLDAQKSQLVSLAGITRRRNPEWIMNMITGVVTTLETDAAAMQKLEACPSRQPGARLNIEQARDYLEMLRSVDVK